MVKKWQKSPSFPPNSDAAPTVATLQNHESSMYLQPFGGQSGRPQNVLSQPLATADNPMFTLAIDKRTAKERR